MRRNLFDVDLDALASRLRDANARLERSSRAFLSRARDILRDASTVEDGRLDAARAGLQAKRAEVRATRLEDSKPFRDATRVIDAWFKPMEADLLRAEHAVVKEIERRMRARPAMPARRPEPVLIEDEVDELIAPLSESSAPGGPDWHTRPSVVSVDHEVVDLNVLRPYFTAKQIEAAVKKMLKDQPKARLLGVRYENRLE
ncbi:MAG: hypothetical protein AAFR44_08250 [Pseudomonadota bacterium]